MFAIINQKTDKFVYGTDYRYNPPHQRTSNKEMLTFPNKERAFFEFRNRQCGKDYAVVVLKKIEIKRIYKMPEGKEIQ
ncbi:MAG: hypothetical protein IJA34_00320 [Lachnospiraceae bacterium]|nr:hypothetical protein [Lachnospiraceae bacterium]